MHVDTTRYRRQRPPFGRWLLAQASRPDVVGELARAADADGHFPRDGSYEDVSRRLNEVGADGDIHHALEDAELDYLSH